MIGLIEKARALLVGLAPFFVFLQALKLPALHLRSSDLELGLSRGSISKPYVLVFQTHLPPFISH
jgi:hypothetical protein